MIFFSFCVKERNSLDPANWELPTLSAFKKAHLKFIRPEYSPTYNIFDPLGLKLLSSLRLKSSHLNEHKFYHNFRDQINPLCNCNSEIESTEHYLLRCQSFFQLRKVLLDNLVKLVGPIMDLSDSQLIKILLYGDERFSMEMNTSILNSTITFLKESERCSVPLL